MLNTTINKFLLSTAVIALLTTSCKKVDFGDTNKNPDPNANTFPNTAELLTSAEVQTGYGLATNAVEAGDYVQYFQNVNYPDLYQTTNAPWSGYYAGPLMDLQRIIEVNKSSDATKAAANGSNANQIAIARILKAYFFSIVTDRWGDVPYKQALTLNINPTYDKQRDIYVDLLKELKEAVAQFDGGATVKGDILLNGNIARWKKFGNSLRMVLAMRVVKADATLAKTEFLAAFNDPAGYVSTNADNVFYQPIASNLNYAGFWYLQYRSRDEVSVSSTFVDALKVGNDKRLAVFAKPTTSGAYVGIPYGRNADYLSNWKSSNQYSRLGAAITAADAKSYIITAAQMLLTKAEAEFRGWTGTTGDATVDYKAAIKASWDQWNITYTQTELDNYINARSTANLLQDIGYQKWVALFPNGQEAWSEWRRLGYPVLAPAVNAINASKRIPRRYAYPINEPSLNATGYNAAVGQLTGGDTHDSQVWWDK